MLIGAITLSMASLAQTPGPISTAKVPGNIEPERLLPTQSIKFNEPQNGTLTADFSRRGSDDKTVVWSENFNSGMDGWSVDPTQNVTWELKKHPTLAIGEADPDDTASLFVDGPYQIYKREISGATSPQFTVPERATLDCMLCFSLNFNDECALEISISDDDFETSELLYTTLSQTGEKPVQWRHIALPIDSWAGRTARLKFTYTYGLKDEIFKVGGYSGSFYIDAITISGAAPVSAIDVTTGESVEFLDLSSGQPTQWLWTMPGAVPSTSTDQNPTVYYTCDGDYDVTLTVTDAHGNSASVTKPQLVHVTGTAPQARILPPASFRYAPTRYYMTAPMRTVTFRDASTGFPTSWQWQIAGVCADSHQTLSADTETVDVAYSFLHDWDASLTVGNQHGSSLHSLTVSAEYEGSVCNLRPEDSLTTFDLDGRGSFPGSNSMNITAYAEKFSAPSAPVRVNGATVFFTKNTTVSVADQIANIGVHLYTVDTDGKPGRKLDSDWWCPYELNISTDPTVVAGTTFTFDTNPIVTDEFFIVVDGIPDTSDEADVAFAMAAFRGEGGNAWMLKDGTWREVSGYFPAGANHTDYAIYPYIVHSVMAPVPADTPTTIEVNAPAGEAQFQLFSYMGYDTPVCDADWCRVTSQPNGMTLDTIVIGYDSIPQGMTEREAVIHLTDGLSTLDVTLHQTNANTVTDIEHHDAGICMTGHTLHIEAAPGTAVTVADTQGRLLCHTAMLSDSLAIDTTLWNEGIYIVRAGSRVQRIMVRH